MKLWLLCLFAISHVVADPTPIVMWHGMGDTCCASFSIGSFKHFIEQTIPGVFVLSLRIGNSTIEDLENGYFMHANRQVDYAFKSLNKIDKLKNGFNAIGFSQGSQFLRALVQRYGHQLPPVKNLISLGGQHQGVYGIPQCGALQHKSCDYVREILNYAAYAKWVQESLVQATYWHDPLDEQMYRNHSEFLSDINNEISINATYVNNLKQLEKFVMVMFKNDTVVQPKETEWFSFYAPGQARKIVPLNESRIYVEDRLGLKKMDEEGKLVFLSAEGNHLRMSDDWFINNIIKPYLNNTVSSN